MVENINRRLENTFIDLVWHCASDFSQVDIGNVVELLIHLSNNGNAYAALTLGNYYSPHGLLFKLEHENYKKSEELAYQYDKQAYKLAKGKDTYPETKVIEYFVGTSLDE